MKRWSANSARYVVSANTTDLFFDYLPLLSTPTTPWLPITHHVPLEMQQSERCHFPTRCVFQLVELSSGLLSSLPRNPKSSQRTLAVSHKGEQASKTTSTTYSVKDSINNLLRMFELSRNLPTPCDVHQCFRQDRRQGLLFEGECGARRREVHGRG